MAKCTCPNAACQSINVAAVYFHPDNGPWFRVVYQPERNPASGKPQPLPCPDDLVDSQNYGSRLADQDGYCGMSIAARVLYCYNCKGMQVYPPTPAG
ncbi:hypothetical protein FJY71_00930 [candidate division WOR-3 bacterium]|nr:hypothetical protein [candidate division WOR-3 bacterium]